MMNKQIPAAELNKKVHGLKAQPLETSFLAAVQVLAFNIGENDKKRHFTFLSIFSNLLMTKG